MSREADYSNLMFHEPGFGSRNRFCVNGCTDGGPPTFLYTKPEVALETWGGVFLRDRIS